MAEGLIAMVQLSVKTTVLGKVAHTQKRERRPVTPHPENCEILEVLTKTNCEILEVLSKINCEILEVLPKINCEILEVLPKIKCEILEVQQSAT